LLTRLQICLSNLLFQNPDQALPPWAAMLCALQAPYSAGVPIILWSIYALAGFKKH
jgi:hypothetical protein